MPRLKDPRKTKNVNTIYIVWCEIVPSENKYSIVYGCTTTFFENFNHAHEFLINQHECDKNVKFKMKYIHLNVNTAKFKKIRTLTQVAFLYILTSQLKTKYRICD